MTRVLNLDGLVGPNHNYGGLAQGNLASALHRGQISNPRSAALQGLEKMHALHQLGLAQGILPPQPRPQLSLLYAAGFRGTTAALLEQAYKESPRLLEACYSASSMWAANAATITPACDSLSGKVQISPANLVSGLHRSLEAPFNLQFFRRCFSDPEFFQVHPPLPAQNSFADEGAANHTRLSDPATGHSLNLFIYGRSDQQSGPDHFPARQSKLASNSLIRRHRIPPERALLVQQNPDAINAGAFHNDVVAVGHENFLLLHQQAFSEQAEVLKTLRQQTRHWQAPLSIFEVSQKELSLSQAVKTYLFNSQLVTLTDGSLLLIAPEESHQDPVTAAICERILAEDNPVSEVRFFNLRQSMNNGGGPACLRLAIPLREQELSRVAPGILINEERYQALQSWIEQHYRDRLCADDLRDPQLVEEIAQALSELNLILQLPELYH
ncbi:N-succinylarginine dihydrolase [Neptuniibacter halophilus]|uniref:N-succinylarginine dihydrolase n=1 Tax=Neptuniibacter halophilus TaxID=651666 RepID=UPI0025725552|nr:N-succinylarginine dihydrolase [Neptuniibacter halophilus]